MPFLFFATEKEGISSAKQALLDCSLELVFVLTSQSMMNCNTYTYIFLWLSVYVGDMEDAPQNTCFLRRLYVFFFSEEF